MVTWRSSNLSGSVLQQPCISLLGDPVLMDGVLYNTGVDGKVLAVGSLGGRLLWKTRSCERVGKDIPFWQLKAFGRSLASGCYVEGKTWMCRHWDPLAAIATVKSPTPLSMLSLAFVRITGGD